MGRIHADNLLAGIRGARLIGVADPFIADIAWDDGGHEVARYHDYEEMLQALPLDAVVVASATTSHGAVLNRVLDRKIPVLCEKPIAHTFEDSLRIHRRVEQEGAVFQLGMMRRFDPNYAEAFRLIQTGVIGRPYHFYSVSRDKQGPPIDVVRYSGGFFVDTGVHDFDLARWLLGTEIESIFARGDVFVNQEYRSIEDVDQAHASFQGTDGSLGLVELGRNAIYGYDIRTEILGTQGTLTILSGTPYGTVLQVEGRIQTRTYDDFADRFQVAYRKELQAFVDAVRYGQPVAVSSADGVKALAVALAAQTSLKTGAPQTVPTWDDEGWSHE
jgi:scyllo-inositol 2-dehydrogenase (NAD+)